jgi:hypothetical protein
MCWLIKLALLELPRQGQPGHTPDPNMYGLFKQAPTAHLGPRAQLLGYQPLALEHLHRMQQVIRNLSPFLKPFDILKVEHFIAPFSVDVSYNPVF